MSHGSRFEEDFRRDSAANLKMSVVKPDRNAERGPGGRWLPGVVPKGARPWQPGASANPGGKGGLYHEMQRLAREFTPEATKYLIEIAADKNEDSRNRIVAMSMLLDRAWGKPKEYDPLSEAQETGRFDPALLTPEQRQVVRQAMLLIRGATADAEAVESGSRSQPPPSRGK